VSLGSVVVLIGLMMLVRSRTPVNTSDVFDQEAETAICR